MYKPVLTGLEEHSRVKSGSKAGANLNQSNFDSNGAAKSFWWKGN